MMLLSRSRGVLWGVDSDALRAGDGAGRACPLGETEEKTAGAQAPAVEWLKSRECASNRQSRSSLSLDFAHHWWSRSGLRNRTPLQLARTAPAVCSSYLVRPRNRKCSRSSTP